MKISFFQNVNMAHFAELSESKLTTILEEKDAENTKKATKVTLIKHISRLLARKRIEESRAFDMKN